MRTVAITLLLSILLGCGNGACPAPASGKARVARSCGIDVYYEDGKAKTLNTVQGYSFRSRYSIYKERAGKVKSIDGCVYELTEGWYGDSDCAFHVSPDPAAPIQ